MSALFPETARRSAAPSASAEAVDTARRSVRELLQSSESFGALPPDERRDAQKNSLALVGRALSLRDFFVGLLADAA